MTRNLFLSVLISFLFLSCKNDVCYHKVIELNNEFKRDSILNFEFSCSFDTVNVFLVLENKFSYKYSNIFFQSKVFVEDSLRSKDLNELQLMDLKSGKPLGAGSYGNYAHEVPIYKNMVVEDKKKIKIQLNHFMRDYNISDVSKVGILVRKNAKK